MHCCSAGSEGVGKECQREGGHLGGEALPLAERDSCGVSPSGEAAKSGGKEGRPAWSGEPLWGPWECVGGGHVWGQALSIPEILMGTRGQQPIFLLPNHKQM